MKIRILVLLISLIIVAHHSWADFTSGLTAYQKGDYETALQEWTKSAENGDLAAMRNIGHMFRWGKGVDKNPARASYWYHRAAKAGFDNAQYNLAILYLTGEGVPKNESEAVRWLELASKQGHLEARKKLEELQVQAQPVVHDEETLEKLANIIVEQPKAVLPPVPVETPPPTTVETPPPAPVETVAEEFQEPVFLVHIGSYNNQETALRGWQQMMKKMVGFERFDMELKEVNIPNKGKMLRLFAKGGKTDALELCRKMKQQKEYCVVYDENHKAVF